MVEQPSASAVYATPIPPSVPLPPDPNEKTRRWVTFALVILLGTIILIAAAIMFIMLWYSIPDGAHFALDWMGIALGPVSALAGSAITFYLERARRS